MRINTSMMMRIVVVDKAFLLSPRDVHCKRRARRRAAMVSWRVFPDPSGNSDAQLKGPPAKVQRDPVHQQLGLREDRVAGVARFPVAWTTPNRSNAVMRQTTIMELAPDEEMEDFLVISILAGGSVLETRQFHPGPSIRRRHPSGRGAGKRSIAPMARQRPEKRRGQRSTTASPCGLTRTGRIQQAQDPPDARAPDDATRTKGLIAPRSLPVTSAAQICARVRLGVVDAGSRRALRADGVAGGLESSAAVAEC
jgi:hypothetical protein